jgi:hypothetical protein
MKKFLLGLLLAIGLAVGVVFFLKDYLAKADLEKRVENLFNISNGMRTGLSTRESDLMVFFVDSERYDPQVPRPEQWIAQWAWENRAPDFDRKVATFKVLEHSPSDAYVEFTVQEGLKGEGSRGISSDMKTFSYEARMSYDAAGSVWKIKSLKRKDGQP